MLIVTKVFLKIIEKWWKKNRNAVVSIELKCNCKSTFPALIPRTLQTVNWNHILSAAVLHISPWRPLSAPSPSTSLTWRRAKARRSAVRFHQPAVMGIWARPAYRSSCWGSRASSTWIWTFPAVTSSANQGCSWTCKRRRIPPSPAVSARDANWTWPSPWTTSGSDDDSD